jgi:CYTH domain-containing protein
VSHFFIAEQKFLAILPIINYSIHPSIEIEQAYLSYFPELRIRKANNCYFLTEKGEGTLSRTEKEATISKEEYDELTKKVISNTIHKTRYLIPLYNDLVAELDIYTGKLQGLAIVEVEFKDETSAINFYKPDWFGEDVTSDMTYKNKNLVKLLSEEL